MPLKKWGYLLILLPLLSITVFALENPPGSFAQAGIFVIAEPAVTPSGITLRITARDHYVYKEVYYCKKPCTQKSDWTKLGDFDGVARSGNYLDGRNDLTKQFTVPQTSLNSGNNFIAVFTCKGYGNCNGGKWLLQTFTVIPGFEARADGAVRITNCVGSCQNPVFSPDAKQLLFTRFRNGYNTGASELVRINLDGTGEMIIVPTTVESNVNVPFGSWVGSKITWASDRAGRAEEIYVADANGANIQKVTTHDEATGSYIEPVFNPRNPSKIVFEFAPPVETNPHKLMLVEVDKNNRITTLTNDAAYDDRLPSWSPDGTKILFQRAHATQDDWKIYTAQIGLEPSPTLSQLTMMQSTSTETDNSWAGEYILSSSTAGGTIPTIFAFSPGKSPMRITNSPKEDGAPSYSPDGRWVAFESHRTDENSPSDIWIIPSPPLQFTPQSFAYWLTGVRDPDKPLTGLNALLAQPRDIYVVDINDAQLSLADIAQLHAQGKKVFSYISIGEAEKGRDYFNNAWVAELATPTAEGCKYAINRQVAPNWLYAENCAWNSFKVKYWDQAWQQIVFDKVKAIAQAGYDGAALDIVDGYYYFESMVPDADKRPTAAQDMVTFVGAMRAQARTINPSFMMLPHNAAPLYPYPGYTLFVDGITVEDTWYDGDNAQSPEHTNYVLPFLDTMRADGKFILVLDYPTSSARKCDFMQKARQRGFVPAPSPRGLDFIMDPPACRTTSIVINAPTEGQTVYTATTPVKFDALTTTGQSVKVYLDTVAQTPLLSGWDTAYTTPIVTNGPHSVRMDIINADGSIAASTTRNFIVTVLPLAVSIISPNADNTVFLASKAHIYYTVTSAQGRKVKVFVDNTLMETTAVTEPIITRKYISTALSTGQHQITVEIVNADGTSFSPPVSATRTFSIAPAASFGYRLHEAASAATLLSKLRDIYLVDGDELQLTSTDITQIHAQGKKIFSYVPIGAAYKGKPYFQDTWITQLATPTAEGCMYTINRQAAPSWLYAEDCGINRFKVAYWESAWQQIMTDKVKVIAQAGYDGIVLDAVDVYYFFQSLALEKRTTAAQDMVDFIKRIAQQAKAIKPGFFIIVQNAPELYQYAGYPESVSGLLKESTWYDDNNVQDPEHTSYVLIYMDMMAADGKVVLEVEYATDTTKQCDFIQKATQRGFKPIVAVRDLNSILDNPTCGTTPPTTYWKPAVGATFQWQLDGTLDTSVNAQVYDIDLFENDAATVSALHAQGRKVICYINVGAWQPNQPDSAQFPASVLGSAYEPPFSEEKWLDIRSDLIKPIMLARLDLCKQKGFDAIEPDNINGFQQTTGFPLTAQDQLNYNKWLADEAHKRGLSIGLKNDEDQVTDLLPYYDWALLEHCFADNFCDKFAPFTQAGKAVFMTEYTEKYTPTGTLNWNDACAKARSLRFFALLKETMLPAARQVCT
ncbi:endo alpha-1,4 polygalactosaminidase [Candidatus Woesearchaeota archaeon]|nr:endo alpha-1,4 polygalactosaminidase [Candidatus Woesearchaeota archaeon]